MIAKNSLPKLSSIEHKEKSIIKHFSSANTYWQEFKVYEMELPMVPRLISYEEPYWIEIEYVEGKPYLDEPLEPELIYTLADTIGKFHSLTRKDKLCLCHWDNQPSNIIYSQTQIWLIDFSESKFSFPEDDITHLLLFWCAEFPPAQLTVLVERFIYRYQLYLRLDSKVWQNALECSLKRFNKRREAFAHHLSHLNYNQFKQNVSTLSTLSIVNL
ncbi:MAG: phosphotransferase [Candidatus Cloacimonetes bacterium]|nr:phosphotransferase [Candidatus Cloacimonadota bacterium]